MSVLKVNEYLNTCTLIHFYFVYIITGEDAILYDNFKSVKNKIGKISDTD